MKFLPVALAALVGLVSAKKAPISGAELKSRMGNGQFNRRALMRGAKPYGKTEEKLRKLEEDGEFEINGYHSIKFESCLSLKIQDEDLLGENYIYYAQNGQIVAQKSLIVFSVCQSADCYYDADDDKLTFVTDIPSFFGAFADFLPNKVENYCRACEENQDYCFGNLDAQNQEADAEAEDAEQEGAEDQDAEADQEADAEAEGEDADADAEGAEEGAEGEDGDARKLAKTSRQLKNENKVYEYIDCNLCYEYDCFEADNDNQENNGEEEYDFEGALEWLEGLSGCQQIQDQTWNDMNVYAGLICSENGDGVQIGVFLDQNCYMYTNTASFSNLMSYSDQQYFSMSSEVVEYMFTNDFSCYYEEVTYINEYTEVEQQDENQDQNQNENQEAPEAAEWCRTLFEGDFEPLNLYDCGVEQNDNQDNQEDNQEYDENLSTYDWYTYSLSQDQLNDSQEICLVVAGLETFETVYDSNGSGNLYDYRKKSASSWSRNHKGGLPAGVITVIVLAVLAIIGAIALFLKGKSATDNKKAPLINNGSMA